MNYYLFPRVGVRFCAKVARRSGLRNSRFRFSGVGSGYECEGVDFLSFVSESKFIVYLLFRYWLRFYPSVCLSFTSVSLSVIQLAVSLFVFLPVLTFVHVSVFVTVFR